MFWPFSNWCTWWFKVPHVSFNRVESGCMDCDLRGQHMTVTEAEASLLAHRFNEPGHRLLVATPGDGWHRYFTGVED